MLKPLQSEENAAWKLRYRAPYIASAQMARANPSRGLVTSTSTGQYQLYAWDVKSSHLRQLTFRSQGTLFGMISPDGRYIYYLEDEGGNEIGHFVRILFEGGKPEDITPDIPPYSAFGISSNRVGNMLGSTISNNEGFHALVWKVDTDGSLDKPIELHHSHRMMFGPTLSYSGEVGVIMTPKPSEFQYYGLKVFELSSGKLLKELRDESASIMASAFSPIKDDLRLLASSTQSGNNRPFTWDVSTGERIELNLPEIPGDISILDWAADGNRILLANTNMAVQQLYIYELNSNKLTKLNHPPGFYGMGTVFMPDAMITNHEIIAGWQDSTHPPQVIALDRRIGEKTRTVLSAGEVLHLNRPTARLSRAG
jgi:WD40 repeat protein